MIYRFWLWLNVRSQQAIARNARAELLKHIKNRVDFMDNDPPDFKYQRWEDRKERLRKFYIQEAERLLMMGGSL